MQPVDTPPFTEEINIVNRIVYGNSRTMLPPVGDIPQDRMLANLGQAGPDTSVLESIIAASKEDNRVLTEYLHAVAFKE